MSKNYCFFLHQFNFLIYQNNLNQVKKIMKMLKPRIFNNLNTYIKFYTHKNVCDYGHFCYSFLQMIKHYKRSFHLEKCFKELLERFLLSGMLSLNYVFRFIYFKKSSAEISRNTKIDSTANYGSSKWVHFAL